MTFKPKSLFLFLACLAASAAFLYAWEEGDPYASEEDNASQEEMNPFLRAELGKSKAPQEPKVEKKVDEFEELKDYEVSSDALVIIEGDKAVGSGFIAKLQGFYFIVTNTHVVAPNSRIRYTTVTGSPLKTQGGLFVSKDRDLAIQRIEEPEAYLEVEEDLNSNVKIDDKILVIGNSQGAGVVRRLYGKVQGIDPDVIEVSAKFVQGNSGCPIILPRTEKVIGLASYARAPDKSNKLDKDSEFTKYRRFAYRIDNNEEWESTTLAKLHQENEVLEAFVERSKILLVIAYYLNEEEEVLTSYKNEPSLEHVFEPFLEKFNFDYKKTRGNVTAMQRFISGLERELVRDVPTTRNALTLSWLQQEMKAYLPLRKKAAAHLRAVDYDF